MELADPSESCMATKERDDSDSLWAMMNVT